MGCFTVLPANGMFISIHPTMLQCVRRAAWKVVQWILSTNGFVTGHYLLLSVPKTFISHCSFSCEMFLVSQCWINCSMSRLVSGGERRISKCKRIQGKREEEVSMQCTQLEVPRAIGDPPHLLDLHYYYFELLVAKWKMLCTCCCIPYFLGLFVSCVMCHYTLSTTSHFAIIDFVWWSTHWCFLSLYNLLPNHYSVLYSFYLKMKTVLFTQCTVCISVVHLLPCTCIYLISFCSPSFSLNIVCYCFSNTL